MTGGGLVFISPIISGDFLAIGIGAIVGAISRYQIGRMAAECIANDPLKYQKYQGWHTSMINIGGSFILGSISGVPTTTSITPPATATPTTPTTSSFDHIIRTSKIQKLNQPLGEQVPSNLLQPRVTKPQLPFLSSSSPTLPSSSSKGLLTSFFPRSIGGSGSPRPFSISPRTKLMLGIGFCGSFTTFSTFSVDVVNWINTGQTKKAVAYVLTNNVGGIAAAATGLFLMKKICKVV